MISFVCSGCGKQLKVKDELVGKKAKCPGCARVLSVPEKIEALPSGASPPPAPEMPTLPPTAPKSLATQVTVPPPGRPEVTRSTSPADSEQDSSLTDFLSPPQADDELGRLGGFRILKILGHGGMGVVFQGEDAKLGRKVAIKAMLPHLAESRSGQQRFLREARAAAALENDHIVAIHYVAEDRGAPFIVMPFLKGELLDVRLQREEKLPIPEILRIGREMAKGLLAAHAAGLIHRDIKPANVWLEAPEGRVKILDFGLARATAGETGLTQQGAIIGTPAYMAPEQGRGEIVDGRCDLFSLGCVLYRMGTGRMPFQGNDTVSLLVAVAMDNPPPPVELRPELPGALSDLVMQLLAKKPEDRPQSGQVVVQALQEIEGQTPELMAPPGTRTRQEKAGGTTKREAAGTPVGPAAKKRSRLPWLVGGGVLGLGVLAAAIVLFWPTPQGTVRIESDDSNVEIVFDKSGPAIKGADKEPITLRPGEYGLLVKRGDFSFATDKLLIQNGQTITLKVELLGNQMRLIQGGKVLGARQMSFTNSLGMKFMLIPAGKFTMGSSQEEIDRLCRLAVNDSYAEGCFKSEGPEHEVEITQPFYMGDTHVTVAQFRQFVTQKKYSFGDKGWEKPAFEQKDDYPIVRVTWQNAVDFCDWLSEQEGKTYRLPTEAEWEYCCRAGKTGTRYFFGDDDAELAKYAWYGGNTKGRTHAVGKLKANDWGLFDMHGNAWQWCQDFYDENYYKRSPKEDPPGGAGGERVIRGGAWNYEATHCRCAHRLHYHPGARYDDRGFRVVLVPSFLGGVRP